MYGETEWTNFLGWIETGFIKMFIFVLFNKTKCKDYIMKTLEHFINSCYNFLCMRMLVTSYTNFCSPRNYSPCFTVMSKEITLQALIKTCYRSANSSICPFEHLMTN